jgi:uncharacterized protein (DUF1684 family)
MNDAHPAPEGAAGALRPAALSLVVLLAVLPGITPVPASSSPAAPSAGAPAAADAERTRIREWRARRVEGLTGDDGWLTLAGLFWLKQGDNSFGRGAGNLLMLDNPALPDTAGSFLVTGQRVRFVARPGAGVTHEGEPVSSLDMAADTTGKPTVLARGALRFFVIERAGNLGVRVRDLDNPHRLQFRGLSYFPVSTAWVITARFEPYRPAHRLRIVNILGMQEDAESPGALVFIKNGREWRLDTILEQPGDKELFVMFADRTSGHETYGAGRFLYAPLPAGDTVRVDFNEAYNPPCALNDFATCPLPPWQNRLKLRVDAGEKTYAGAPSHHS